MTYDKPKIASTGFRPDFRPSTFSPHRPFHLPNRVPTSSRFNTLIIMPTYDDDDFSSSSEASAVTHLVSQLNDVETAVLTSSTTRGKDSNKELLKQLAMLKLQLLTDDTVACETPKSGSRASVGTGRAPRRGSGANSVGGGSIGGGSIGGHSRGGHSRGGHSRGGHSRASAGRRSHKSPGSQTLHFTQNRDLDDDMDDGPEIEIPFSRREEDAVSALNSSPSVIAMSVADARKARHAKAVEDKEFDNAGYQPDIVKEYRKGPELMSTTLWSIFASLVTFPVPDCLICKTGVSAKKAWREKVAIFCIFLFISAMFVVMVSLVPVYICVESDEYFDRTQVAKKGWNSIFGKVYDLERFVDLHPGGAATLEKYFGLDTSRLFARLPPTELPSFCLSDLLNETVFNATNSLGLQDLHCSSTEEEMFQYGDAACHVSFAGIDEIKEKLGDYEEGVLVMPGWDIGPNGLPDGTQVIIIDRTVYNVTQYMDGLRYVPHLVGMFSFFPWYP